MDGLEIYEGTTEEVEDEQKSFSKAAENAVKQYFERNPGKQGKEIRFRVVEQYVVGSHNPIGDYIVYITPSP
jgi:hypothetical protein